MSSVFHKLVLLAAPAFLAAPALFSPALATTTSPSPSLDAQESDASLADATDAQFHDRENWFKVDDPELARQIKEIHEEFSKKVLPLDAFCQVGRRFLAYRVR